MTIKHLDLKQWDEIISRQGETLPFLSSELLSCLADYSKAKMELWGFYEGDQLIGYMPSFYSTFGPIKTLFSPPYNSAIPFLGYSLTNDYQTKKQNKKEGTLKTIAKDIRGAIQDDRVQFVNLELDSQKTDIRPFLWQGFRVQPSYDYAISLERDEKDIWNSFKLTARNDISTAERKGIVIGRESNAHEFWVMEESRYNEQKLKIPLFGEDYAQLLISKFSSSIHLYYAYDSKGATVGTAVTFTRNSSVFLWMGITTTEGSVNPNVVLIWELIKLYRNNGFKEFIIEGANQERLCQFKSKFNPTPIIRFSVTHQTALGKVMSATYRKFVKRL